ncbi:MAG: hypothetical protein RBT60_03185 [Candidatus Krumholzibacteria bacterium]|jgi:hypothetical protein|nr:hypothetical protein [Candidatus Krumholzibacteria bacterium]
MRVLAVVILLIAQTAMAEQFASSYDDESIVVLAKVNRIEVKILQTLHDRFLAYSHLELMIQEELYGELPEGAVVLSPCVAYCDGLGEPRIEAVTGQAWIHEGDLALLFLRPYTLKAERFFIVKDTRILIGDIGDSTRLLIPTWESWGIDETTCRERDRVVINGHIVRSMRDGNQRLGEIRRISRGVER